MKKYALIITAVLVLIITVLGISYVVNADNASSEKLAEDTGAALKEGAQILAGDDPSEYASGQENIVMSIEGMDISDGFYKYKLGLMTSIGYDDPGAAMIDLLKKYAVQWKFAAEKNILPTEEEIAAEVEANKEAIYEDENAYASLLSFLKGAGLTESEYWDIIQTKYEAQYALAGVKVAEYCKEHDVSEPEWKDADVKLYD